MKRNILTTMGLLILIGFALSGFFGAVAGILVAAIIGIIYGTMKHDKTFVKWSAIALSIAILCIITFYLCLIYSDM